MASQKELTPTQLPETGATTLARQAATMPQVKRLLFVDNLRILLICGVLLDHLNDTYGAIGDWEYHDPATNLLTGSVLTTLNGILMACGMGIFFLISAYFTPGSYDHKGGASFLRDRLVRLGLPLLLYDLLIQPLVVYIAGGLPGSFYSFYSTYLLQMRGVTGVVWFLAVLLLFDLLYAGWRGLSKHRPPALQSPGNPPSTRAIYGFIFVLGLVTFVFRIWLPESERFQLLSMPLGYLPQYLGLYILGLVAYRRNWFFALTPRMGRVWLQNALIAMVVLIVVAPLMLVIGLIAGVGAAGTQTNSFAWVMGQLNFLGGGFHWQALFYALWEAFLVVAVSIGLLVLFRQRWNHQGRLAKELAADVYTVYLIHAPVLVGFAYVFSMVALYPLLKWGIAVLITIPLCFLISSVIRRIPLVNRVL
jgi:surface polysaccharide O-acyltransferase-like enzyme